MAENNWLEGRHALVTGGGTGIGASAAAHLHAAGAKVTLLGRRMEPLQQVAERIGGYAVSCDVTQPDQIAKAFEEARTLNGPIELLVVNAGIAESAPFHKMTRESWNRIIATNLTVRGPIWGTGLQFRPVIAQFSDGREALRLIATNVAPVLDIQSDSNGTKVVFPANYLGQYVLQATSSLSAAVWQDVPGNSASVAVATSDNARFFRLKKTE